MNSAISKLIEKGVNILDPDSTFIAADVNLDNIFPSATIYPGCRIFGSDTCIGPESIIGCESPVTIKNCQIGKGVTIAGGFLDSTTLLDGANTGDGLHSRPGTLLEESSSVAHTVGLKQTVLMPFVTLGSLINFCDILMAGGTSSKNHSEIGSSYIHFNFTPHQDKATASLLGDVPNGIWLDQNPIFLGGQGGLVGPRKIAFGTVVGAGIVLRRDVTTENVLISGSASSSLKERSYNIRMYGPISDIVNNCIEYIANINALEAWYTHIKTPILSQTPYGKLCAAGALKRIKEIKKERFKRLEQFAEKLLISVEEAGEKSKLSIFQAQKHFAEKCPDVIRKLSEAQAPILDNSIVDGIVEHVSSSSSYTKGIQSIPEQLKQSAKDWLCSFVNNQINNI